MAERTKSGKVAALDTKAERLAKGADIKAELMRRAGGALSPAEVGILLGITHEAVNEHRRQGRLIAVPTERGHVYPRCQFDRNGVVPGLPDALATMPIESPWMRLEWLLTPDDALGGRSPLDALRAGDREAVRQLARGYGE
jgi:hypothetical protein